VPLWERIEKTTFPGFQGTPYLNNVAAKAVFFKETLSSEYRDRQFKIIENARALADAFLRRGYEVLTGGTDNHMFLMDVSRFRAGLTGLIAQKCLEDCGVIVNMNRLPNDSRSARVTSGARLGTPIVTRNGMGREEMEGIADVVDAVLTRVQIHSDREYELSETFARQTRQRIRQLCETFPLW
jgi:glycine hydroxymethyltransferase